VLTSGRDKMLRPAQTTTKAVLRGRCPRCGAVGLIVLDRSGGGIPRPVILSCACPVPPAPEPELTEAARP
jgi:hypothetical protein